ncbi:alpha/beta fold hydrolase [Methylomonas sp. HW2-6]|uniref:alpha/beta fold hydrolase n=1 Tax=Methylomonas sp. HW2-6 TaxID=3376687 RepID=UPI004041041F
MKLALSNAAMLPLLAGLLNGCGGNLPQVATTNVAGRQVEFALSRHDSLPVVFETGLGGHFTWWEEVYPPIAESATALVYNRAGIGNSDAVASPRDGRHVVQELRELLISQKLAPPYVLVGHSLGGLYLQWYARYYPQEVAALILVDSTHPAQLKGQGAVEHWPFWWRWLFEVSLSAAAEGEFAEIDRTGDEVLAASAFGAVPVIVLSAAQPLADTSSLAVDSNRKRMELARLYPGAIQIWVDSGHAMPLERPEPIISAIREVLAAVQPKSEPVTTRSAQTPAGADTSR